MYDNTRTCITVKTFQQHRARMVGSYVLYYLSVVGPCTHHFSWFGSGSHMHIAQFVIAMLAAVLELKIRLSHRWEKATFCLQGLNIHIRESKRHLTLVSCFTSHFRTSVSVLLFLYFGFHTSAFSTCPCKYCHTQWSYCNLLSVNHFCDFLKGEYSSSSNAKFGL